MGRQEERALVAALIAPPGSAVIAGPSGIGKTHLARAALDDARAAGLSGTWITATESSRSIPFGALSPLLPGDALHGDAALSPASVLRSIGTRVGDAGDLPDIVVIDDGHLLDEASATLVLQLVVAAATSVLLTVNTRATPPDAITALWKDGAAARVELQPFSRSETDLLVMELLGGTCDPLTLELIWQTTEGNALYIREVLDAARAAGHLTERRGHWHLETGSDASVPLAGLIAARIDRLDPTVRRVLEAVALSAPVPLRILETVVDLDAIAAAEESGLVEVSADRERMVARHARGGRPLRAPGRASAGAVPSTRGCDGRDRPAPARRSPAVPHLAARRG